MGDNKSDDKQPSAPERQPPRATPALAHPGAAGLPAIAELGNRATLAALGKLGRGAPLEPAVRRDMEQRFDADFRDVRVHTDAGAANLAAQQRARAFTIGRDVVFAAGEHAPGTTSGRHLIAHELAHVRQQALGDITGSAASPAATEADADRAADAALGSAAVAITTPAARVVHRKEPTFSADLSKMRARVAIVNDGGEITATLDGHPVLRGTAWAETAVRAQVFGNSVRYYIDEIDPKVAWTPDAPSFITEHAPGWDFTYGGRIGELPNIIDPELPPQEQPKPPKPKPPKPKPPKPPPPKPPSDFIPANFPVEKEKPPEKDRLARLRASMLFAQEDLGQQLPQLTDDELTQLSPDERKQLIDWLTHDSTRTQDPVNQDQLLRLLNTTPESDARRMIDALRADDAIATRMMLEYMDWPHKSELHKSLQLLYNTSLFHGFTIEDLAPRPIPMQPGPLAALDADQIEITADGKVRIKPKLDPFGRDAPPPPFDPFAPPALSDIFGRKPAPLGPPLQLFEARDPLESLFPYKKPKWPIFGKQDPLTDFIQGPAPMKPIAPLSPEGEQRLGTIRKEMGSWSTSGDVIGKQFQAASPLERQLLAEKLGDEGMTKLYDSIDPMDAVIIGSLGPLAPGREKLTEKRIEVMVEVARWPPGQRAAIYSWILSTMSNDEVRGLLSALTEERFLNSTVKTITGMSEYLSKRGIDLESYKQPGGPGGAAIGTGRFLKSIPGRLTEGGQLTELENSNNWQRLQRIPGPWGTYVRDTVMTETLGQITGPNLARGMIGQATMGFSELPFGIYSAAEGMIHGFGDIASGDSTEGVQKIGPAALMIVTFLLTRKAGRIGAVEAGAAEAKVLEEEGLLSPKGPGQFSLKSYTGPKSPAAARVEATLKVNPLLAEASGSLVDELGGGATGLKNVEAAAGYIQGSSAAARLVIKRGMPGVKALVAAGGDVAAAESMLEGGTIPRTPLQLPAKPGPKPPPKPGMSVQEAGEQAALDQGSPGSTLLPAKSAGFDGTKGSTINITGQSTRTRVVNGVKTQETVVQVEVLGGEASQIKELTGTSTRPLTTVVVENVGLAVRKAWKQMNGELTIKASPESLPGQPTVFPAVNVKNPRSIKIIITVPIETPLADLGTARAAAEAWVKQSSTATALGVPVEVVVQYTR